MDACGQGAAGGPRAARAVETSRRSVAAASAQTPQVPGLEGDEDDDDPPGRSESAHDSIDADGDNDLVGNRGKGYFDEDDGIFRGFGRPAGRSEERAFAGLAERFLAVESRADGGAACALIKHSVAVALPDEYGTGLGPRYLRGARTCTAVMSRLLRHLHGPLSHQRRVTGVRVGPGGQVYVLLGSKTWPASYLPLEREGGEWRVGGILPLRLT